MHVPIYRRVKRQHQQSIEEDDDVSLRIVNTSQPIEPAYDYGSLKAEYDNNLQEAKSKIEALNKTEFEEPEVK